MRFSITGLNHTTAPVQVREQLAFDEASLPDAFRDLTSRAGLQEALILSTCNRVEVALTAGDEIEARGQVVDFLCRSRHVEAASLTPHLYHYEGPEAIRHLFRVAASLDSMVVGEPQILGQMKSAFALAKAHGGAGAFLESVLTRAFSVAKRVRSELAARYLHRSGADQIFVTNRTHDRAVEMAELFRGSVVDYNRFLFKLPEIDIVIASSGAPHFILYKEEMKQVIHARRNRPMFLIDIAVPRNIEPSVNELDNVFLYDMDDLQKVVEENRQGRRKHAEQAEQIIAEEVDRMLARLKSREVAPTIVRLQEQLEQLRLAEVERTRGKLGVLTPQQEEALEALTRGIIAKIAHAPIAELRKRAAEPDGVQIVELIRRVFRLEE
jgi:glutamyl-tRNA reductase